MAKGQKKSNKEIRKPKAEKPKKTNASQPSQKTGVVKGLDNMKNGPSASPPPDGADPHPGRRRRLPGQG